VDKSNVSELAGGTTSAQSFGDTSGGVGNRELSREAERRDLSHQTTRQGLCRRDRRDGAPGSCVSRRNTWMGTLGQGRASSLMS
jgi:hypothetical protein